MSCEGTAIRMSDDGLASGGGEDGPEEGDDAEGEGAAGRSKGGGWNDARARTLSEGRWFEEEEARWDGDKRRMGEEEEVAGRRARLGDDDAALRLNQHDRMFDRRFDGRSDGMFEIGFDGRFDGRLNEHDGHGRDAVARRRGEGGEGQKKPFSYYELARRLREEDEEARRHAEDPRSQPPTDTEGRGRDNSDVR